MIKKNSKNIRLLKRRRKLGIAGLVAYFVFTALFLIPLFDKFHHLEVHLAINLLVIGLLIAGLGIGRYIVEDIKTDASTIAGIFAVAVISMFPAFFLMLALGWGIYQ